MRIILLLAIIFSKVILASGSENLPAKTDSTSTTSEPSSFDFDCDEMMEFLLKRGTPDKNELRIAIRSLDSNLLQFLDDIISRKKKSGTIIEVDTRTFRLLPGIIQKCLLYRNL